MRAADRVVLVVLGAAVLGTACQDVAPVALTLPYEPAAVPIVDAQRLPFPSDLYRDDSDQLHFEAGPDSGTFAGGRFLPQLASLGAYGNQQSVYFGLAGPASAMRSLQLDGVAAPDALTATAYIVGPLQADSATTVPVEVHYDAARQLLSVTPALGYPLASAGRFAALVSRRALARLLGQSVHPDPSFVRSIIEGKPESEAEARAAQTQRTDIVHAAAAAGIALDDLVSATVYTVQTPTADLDVIAQHIDSHPAPQPTLRPNFYGSGLTGSAPLEAIFGVPGDVPFFRWREGGRDPVGVVHDHVAQVFTGTMTFTMWSDTRSREPFARDEEGRPEPFGTQEIEFILMLPDCPQPEAGYPVVIGGHGLSDEKVFVLGLADAFATQCLAMVGIDAVAHGYRARVTGDTRTNITGEPGPDGLDDGFEPGGLDQIFLVDPLVARTNLLETAAGLMQLARSLRLSTWSLPAGALRPGFKLDGSRIGYVGQSMGGVTGSIFTGTAMDLKAAVINVGGGNFVRIATDSPFFGKLTPAFLIGLDTAPTTLPDRFHPTLALFQAVMEGADPMNYGPRFTMAPRSGTPRKHVILQTGHQDQLIADSTGAGLARAAGFPLLGANRPHPPLYQSEAYIPLPTGTTMTLDGVAYGSGLVVFDPADHNFINSYCAKIEWNYEPPYDRNPNPYVIANPTISAQAQAARFLATALADAPEIPAIEGGVRDHPDCAH